MVQKITEEVLSRLNFHTILYEWVYDYQKSQNEFICSIAIILIVQFLMAIVILFMISRNIGRKVFVKTKAFIFNVFITGNNPTFTDVLNE